MIRKLSLLLIGALMGAGMVVTLSIASWETAGIANAASSDTYRQLNLFGDVFERVRREYVEIPDDDKLIASALNGMLTSLDPHSSYMSPDSFEDMTVETQGEFGGLGIQVTMDKGRRQGHFSHG